MDKSNARGLGAYLIGGGVMMCMWLLALQGCAGDEVTARFNTLPRPPLTDVWGSSASNVWAVGYGGWMWHFDGSSWTSASVGPAFYSERIWGTSATDAWAVGPGNVLHYDGVGWYSQSDPVLTARQLSAGWGAGQDDQWAAGSSGAFLHFNGSRWSPVASEDAASGFVYGMWGVTPSRIWAVSRTGTSGRGVGAIWQYNGAQWGIVARDTINVTGVWASSADDAWVVGDFGTVLHGTPAH